MQSCAHKSKSLLRLLKETNEEGEFASVLLNH